MLFGPTTNGGPHEYRWILLEKIRRNISGQGPILTSDRNPLKEVDIQGRLTYQVSVIHVAQGGFVGGPKKHI
jgi:hypothetical protein